MTGGGRRVGIGAWFGRWAALSDFDVPPQAALEALAAFAGRLDGPDLVGRDPAGWPVLGAEAEAFRAAAYAGGWVVVFDWQAWSRTPEGAALLADRAALARSDRADLARLLTALVRVDRFSEGALAARFEDGTMAAIAGRARDLLAAGA